MEPFDVIIVEDVRLELKGTVEIFRTEIPEARIIGTAMSEKELWHLFDIQIPDLLMLDLGIGGSTTVGIDICRKVRSTFPSVRILIFTGEIVNETLWVSALKAGANGIILKTGELLTRTDVMRVMEGRIYVFNDPILEKIVIRFIESVKKETMHHNALLKYEIDEFDERFLRHLALGYTKEMIASLHGMPFGVKSLEKRQSELVTKLFPEGTTGVNATRLSVRAIQLHILDPDNLKADDE